MDESKFQIGDIVRISRKSEYYNDKFNYNPKDMNGKILKTSNVFGYQVNWNNDTYAYYSDSDLALVRRSND